MSITTILNVYRRPEHLRYQIEAILNQSVKSDQIWIWVNKSKESDQFDFESINSDLIEEHDIRIVRNNFNWKFCGRFSLACMVDTEYTAIFDDDTMPGVNWYKNCLETIDNYSPRPVLGGVGAILKGDCMSYLPVGKTGWSHPNGVAAEADMAGHAWFFPASYIKHMWVEKPMWENGEDMHFSAMCQIHGGIKTIVPPHREDDKSRWSSLRGTELGVSNVSSSCINQGQFYHERNSYVKRLRKLGWTPIAVQS